MSGAKTLNREAQECWDDDGGSIPLNLDTQTTGSGRSMIDSTALVNAHERTMLLDHLEVANRYVAESEHRIERQQNFISKLRAKGQIPLLAIAFLRSLQASRVRHRAGLRRLNRAPVILEDKTGSIQP